MKLQRVIVGEGDMQKLGRLVESAKHSLFRDQHQIELLEQMLQGAEVRKEDKVPRAFIKMYSRVRVLDFDTQQKKEYTLVYPKESDISQSLISILAPVGTALLGRKRGNTVVVRVPGGVRKLKIEQVISPRKYSKAEPRGQLRRFLRCDEFSPA